MYRWTMLQLLFLAIFLQSVRIRFSGAIPEPPPFPDYLEARKASCSFDVTYSVNFIFSYFKFDSYGTSVGEYMGPDTLYTDIQVIILNSVFVLFVARASLYRGFMKGFDSPGPTIRGERCFFKSCFHIS